MNPEIRWGVIGAGDVCRVKSAPAMNKIRGSRMVAVMRRNLDKAKAYAAEHNVPKWYDNADELLADPEVNAVYIATPPDVHLELTRKAAAAGKPVYVEKPMARTHRECTDMIAACEDAEIPLFVAYYRRTLPNYLKIRELLNAGAIGDIRSVHIQMNKPADLKTDSNPANWRVDPEVAGGGYFYDLGSHQLDFLDFLFGPIIDATGFSANQAGIYKAEDLVTGTFRFSNGVLGTGCWNFATGKSSETDLTIITGSKGKISYPTFDGYYVDLTTDKPHGNPPAEESRVDRTSEESPAGQISDIPQPDTINTISDRTIRFEFDMPQHIQQPLIQIIVDELLESGWGTDGRPDSNENNAAKTGVSGGCPSTGITAARTNLIMEKLTGRA